MPIRALALILILAAVPALHGQQFGEPFPLTNTRYEASASHSERLVSNGSEFFLFWQALDERSQVTRLTDGERGLGFPLSVKPADVVWNGTAFIVAYGDRTQAFDGEGRPLSEPSRGIGAYASYLAAGGDSMLVLGTSVDAAVSMSLDKDGRPVDGSFKRLVTGTAVAVAGNGNGFAGLVSNDLGIHGSRLTLIMFDRDGAVLSQRVLAEASWDTAAAVASGPGGYLVVHCASSRCAAESLDAAGETTASVMLDTDAFWHRPAAVWDGTGWTVAYKGPQTVRIARLDADGQTILSREEAPGQSAPLLAAIGSRVVIAWAPVYDQPLVTSDLPLAGHVQRLATSLVRSQTLMATVTAHHATLVVWREHLDFAGGDVRAGLRRRNGDWIELAIPPGYDHVAAGTDGRNFLITLGGRFNTSPDAPVAISFTPYGWRRWSVPLPFFAQGIAWNGSMYALIGSTLAGRTFVVSLSRDGNLFEPHLIGEYTSNTAIASDGDGFLAVVGGSCVLPGCYTHAIGIRLDSTLQPVDAEPLVFEDDLFTTSPLVVWDGLDYVVRWDVFDDFARVPPVGPFRRVRGPGYFFTYMPLVRTPDGYATVRDNSWAPAVVERYARGGTLQAAFYFPPAADPYFSRLAVLPDGRIAVVYPARQHDAPHYGASRLMMTISDVVPPLKPEPPVITTTATAGGQSLIAWTPPQQPVNGYRLEYRPPRSPWQELDRWIPDAAPRWITLESPAASCEWRMRAWSDGGVSDYSNVVRSSSATARSSID